MIPDKAFYVNPTNIEGDNFYLDPEESNHATRVLRLTIGDEITLLNGIGFGYHGLIKSVGKTVSGSIIETWEGLGENKIPITLAPALIKRDRFELMLEKSTELGVTGIHPLVLDRCVKKDLNFKRSQKLIISAAKQSKRSRFPILGMPKNLASALNVDAQIICGRMGAEQSISQLSLDSSRNVMVIIGPEGDFSDNEFALMEKANVLFYNLGKRRLRAETAALNSLAVLNEILN